MLPVAVVEKYLALKSHHKNVEQATPGDNVGMNIKNIPKDKPICGGDVMYVVDDPQEYKTPSEVSEFKLP